MPHTKELTLDGSSAVVTGAAGGIGEALALQLADKGVDVALADIDEAGLQRVGSEVEKRGRRVLAQRVNVASAEECEAFAAQVFAWSTRPVSVVFANAGIHGLTSDIDPDLTVWARVIAVNLMGPVHLIKAFVPRLIEQGVAAQFAVTGSQASYVAAPGMGPYIATKHAVWGLADGLRQALDRREGGSDVGISLVAPSRTESGLTRPQVEAARERGGHDAAAAYSSQLIKPAAVAEVMIREVVKRPFWIVPSHEPVDAMLLARVAELLGATQAGEIRLPS